MFAKGTFSRLARRPAAVSIRAGLDLYPSRAEEPSDLARPRCCADPDKFFAADSPGNPQIRRVDLSATLHPRLRLPARSGRHGPGRRARRAGRVVQLRNPILYKYNSWLEMLYSLRLVGTGYGSRVPWRWPPPHVTHHQCHVVAPTAGTRMPCTPIGLRPLPVTRIPLLSVS